MRCTRCQGCLHREHLYRQGPWWWRCIACGDRVDGTILRNRAEQAAAEADRRRAMERDLKEWATWFVRMPEAIQPPG